MSLMHPYTKKILRSSISYTLLNIVTFSFFPVIPLGTWGIIELLKNWGMENAYAIGTGITIALIILYLIGVILTTNEEAPRIIKEKENYLNKKELQLNQRAENIDKIIADKLEQEQNELNNYRLKLNKLSQQLKEKEANIQTLINETSQSYPWLAALYADLFYKNDKKTASQLRYKSRPAIKASQEVSRIAKEKREILQLCKSLEYQLNYYETIFPWLEEFKEIDPRQAWNEIQQIKDSEDSNKTDEYQQLQKWLSPEEYANLNSAEKFQLALDRYNKRKKSNWEIGIEYERFVGYLYEKRGYQVTYIGALKGKEDMGRDLIVSNGKKTLVIQCKYWSAEKTIHEKHIFQLYGSLVHYRISHPKIDAHGVFVTSCTLSDLAKACADYLHIKVKENLSLQTYPQIKCNISQRNGEKIYHLPMDLQYDRVIIDKKRGEYFALTTAEAEANGFRHAYKWHPGDD